MNRRDVLASVDMSVMVPGVVQGSASVDDEWMSPSEYRWRRPDSLDGMEVEESEWEIEGIGTRIESVYRREHPALRIIYLENNDFHLWVGAGNTVYYPDSIADGVDFLRVFDEQVSYRVNIAENGFYEDYTVDYWTATIRENTNKDTKYIAVINGERERFEDAKEMRKTVKTELFKQLPVSE